MRCFGFEFGFAFDLDFDAYPHAINTSVIDPSVGAESADG
jgi:hypothetical protein